MVFRKNNENEYFRKLEAKKFSKAINAWKKEKQEVRESGIGYYLYTYFKGWYQYSDLQTDKSHYTFYKLESISKNVFVYSIIDREKNDKEVSKIDSNWINDFKDNLIERFCLRVGCKKIFLIVIEIESRELTELEKSNLGDLKSSALNVFSDFCSYYFHINTSVNSVWTNSGFLYGSITTRWLRKVINSPRLDKVALMRHESLYGVAPKAKPILGATLIGSFTLIYVLLAWKTGSFFHFNDIGALKEMGAISLPLVSYDQLFTQSFSASFLHRSFQHLFFNSLALLICAHAAERLIGRAWFLIAYSSGAFFSGLFVFALSELNTVTIGASGAITALQVSVLIPLIFRVPQGTETTFFGILIIQSLVPSLIALRYNVSYHSHYGGAVVGLVLGLIILKFWKFGETKLRSGAATFLFALFGGVLIMYTFVLVFYKLDLSQVF